MPSFETTYAPTSLNEVVFASENIESKLYRYIDSKPTKPLLLYGPWGCGKTTIANLVPSAIVSEIEQFDILKIKADPKMDINRKIKSITEFISCVSPNSFGKRFVIIDEFDIFDKRFQETFKGIIDSYGKHACFIFTTNYVDKVDRGIRSRSIELPIMPPAPEQWIDKFKAICIAERVSLLNDEQIVTLINGLDDGRKVFEAIEDYVLQINSCLKSS